SRRRHTSSDRDWSSDVCSSDLVKSVSSTSAVDTDFTAKLVDVWPNGYAQNLTEGILRLRYRNSQEKPELANPGQVYHVTVDLWEIGRASCREGGKIRVVAGLV